ncbi:hypothetical protein LMG2828_01738 [Achromobacter piechaudii]|uniref:hypothetical protein n=1 Tax=Achromobacter piechaudii TaxID=72556 RepID=UPI0014651924|nr:hypothetical protein [Achromobacter piechaudii]CAB3846910.1 hypothetical protein LMG2828_01738 [Achromobacter piechaudii]
MSKQSIRPQGAEGISHARTLQNPNTLVKHNRLTRGAPTIDLGLASIYLDCMLEQKERTRALLSVIQDLAQRMDNPDLSTLVSLAADLNEDHERWYELRECLGLAEAKESGGVA